MNDKTYTPRAGDVDRKWFVVDAEGTFVKAVEVPSPTAPNLAFAPDGKSIFVMSVDDTSNAPYWGKVYEVPLQ